MQRFKRKRIRHTAPLQLVRIPPEYGWRVWPLCHAFIEAACEGAEWTAPELAEAVVNDQMQLWFVSNEQTTAASVVTRIAGEVCFIVACGGNGMANWLGLLDELEAWAKQQGCSIMRLIGRKGWKRKLNDYRETRVVLDKRL